MSSNQPLRIVFAGTPDFSASILDSLIAAGHDICAVYCQPDRRVGRGKKLAAGPVKQLAIKHNIAVEQPLRFNQAIDQDGLTALQKLANYNADLMIVVAYGLILPKQVLDAPKFGCVNIHASLLPRWRGAAPIQRAIQAGDDETGITIMQMDEGLDTGNMLLKSKCLIRPDETGSSLHDRLAASSCELINQFLANFDVNQGSPMLPGERQSDELACYAHKLTKGEAEIDWSENAANIERKIRAFNAWPVCFTYAGKHRIRIWQAELVKLGSENTELVPDQPLKSGKLVEISKHQLLVACGDGELIGLKQLQTDGSRAMNVAEVLNSKRSWFTEIDCLGQPSSDLP
jgi:methionyl-tRNA formyltransferase